jgi:hypothetical protein
MAKTVKEHTPINISLEITQQSELDILKDSVEFHSFIFEQVLEAVKVAIKTKLTEAKVLNIINYQYSLTISMTQFKEVLTKMLSFYEQQEEYMVCKEITKLLKKL